MSLTSPQECGRVKRRKLNGDKQQKPLDLLSVQQRLAERKKALSEQRRQYTERWKCAKDEINGEYGRRQKELEGARVSAHKDLDEIHQSCDLIVEALTKQLRCDIELVKSLRSLKVVEHDVSKMLELVKRATKPLTLCILPTVSFKEGEMGIKLSELHVKGLSELIGETPHRCFSPGVVGLVESYVGTTMDFKGECCLEFETNNVHCVVDLSGGRVATDHDGFIHIRDSQSGKLLLELRGHSNQVSQLAVVDGTRLLSASWDKTLRLWDIQTGRCIRIFKSHTDIIHSVSVFTDSKGVLRAVSGSMDNTIRIWDLDTGDCIQVLRGHTKNTMYISVTTDGSRRLISRSWDRILRVWSIETGECLRVLKGHTNWVTSILTLDDQKRVVSASSDNTLRVWDIETGECLSVLKGHTNNIQSISAFVGGQYIISGGSDKTMRLWNVDTGDCLKVVKMDSKVWRVCCLEDGRVVSVDYDEKVQIWE